MTVSALPVPMLADNYAWLLRESDTGATAMVDPPDADAAVAAIEAAGGRLDAILLTHHHGDHIAGVDELRARFPCRVIGAAADAHRLPKLDQAVREGDRIVFGRANAEVIDTPGHTRGHISIYFPDGTVLLCGDTLFSVGCGRLLEGNADEMFESLRKLAALPAETLVCCGHEYTENNIRFALTLEPDNADLSSRAAEVKRLRGNGMPSVPSRMGEEMRVNPFLRAKDAPCLAAIRSAKDRF